MIIIKVPNDVFIDDTRSLVPDELLILMFILKNRNFDSEMLVSVDLLNYIFKFKKGNDSENKSYIRDLLLSLNSKTYLSFDVPSKFDYNIAFCVNVINVEKGYSGVSSDIFDEIVENNDIIKCKLKLYLYTYIHCYGETGRQVNFNKLSDMCRYFIGNKKYSVRTIFKVINEMDGFYIYRFSGNREDGEITQSSNVYYTKLGLNKIEEYNDQLDKKGKKRKPRKNSEMVYVSEFAEITVGRLKELAKLSSWQKKDDAGNWLVITSEDYEIHRVCQDENVSIEFVRRNLKAIESLKNNPNEKRYDWDEMEKVYQKTREHL